MSDESDRYERVGFKPGNQLWKLADRSKVGKPRSFKSPEDMFDRAIKYFMWCDENPLKEEKVFHNQGEIVYSTVNKMIPYTLKGMFVSMGINTSTWSKYKNQMPEYSSTVEYIEDIVRTQKFNGASAGLLNASFIGRDLGLTDRVEANITANIGLHELSEDELNQRIKENEIKLSVSAQD